MKIESASKGKQLVLAVALMIAMVASVGFANSWFGKFGVANAADDDTTTPLIMSVNSPDENVAPADGTTVTFDITVRDSDVYCRLGQTVIAGDINTGALTNFYQPMTGSGTDRSVDVQYTADSTYYHSAYYIVCYPTQKNYEELPYGVPDQQVYYFDFDQSTNPVSLNYQTCDLVVSWNPTARTWWGPAGFNGSPSGLDVATNVPADYYEVSWNGANNQSQLAKTTNTTYTIPYGQYAANSDGLVRAGVYAYYPATILSSGEESVYHSNSIAAPNASCANAGQNIAPTPPPANVGAGGSELGNPSAPNTTSNVTPKAPDTAFASVFANPLTIALAGLAVAAIVYTLLRQLSRKPKAEK